VDMQFDAEQRLQGDILPTFTWQPSTGADLGRADIARPDSHAFTQFDSPEWQ